MAKCKLKTTSLLLLLAAVTASAFDWKQTDQSLALTSGTNIVWQFNYSREEGKPYFHPLTVGGVALTAYRPPDHAWHWALWFSWKFLNGTNYWEFAKDGKPQGVTELLDVKVEPRADHSARFALSLAYHPRGGANLLTEKRIVEVSAPDKQGGYVIDWDATFTAGDAPALLERTPPYTSKDGVKHGGYAGLSLRMAAETKGWRFFDSDNRTTDKDSGHPGRGFSATGPEATIAILDHPKSFRHPTPWYLVQKMPFYEAAIIFKEPYTVPIGGEFSLRNRILVRPRSMTAKALEAEWKNFAK
jgi:hypothetical protein